MTIEELMKQDFWEAEIPDFAPQAWEQGFKAGANTVLEEIKTRIEMGKHASMQTLTQWLTELKELKEQKPAWSEEDVLAIKRIIDTIQCAQLTRNGKPRALYTDEILDNLVNWLKSLKDRVQPQSQNTWKPSDEQMKALTFACIKNAGIDKSSIKALYDLKEQLKKLKE